MRKEGRKEQRERERKFLPCKKQGRENKRRKYDTTPTRDNSMRIRKEKEKRKRRSKL